MKKEVIVMNKERFIEMLNKAKEDEYGRLYVLGEYNNKIYFGTITTICEDIFKLNYGKEYQDTAELYDRHFWNDDTLKCFVVSTKHNKDIKYKEPERIEEFSFNKNNTLIEEDLADMKDKINELVRISNKYARLLERVESDE